jgi:hypothetical protein
MRLNIGSGAHNMAGYVNADFSNYYTPDVLLEFPLASLPWDDDTFDEVRAFHFFEYCADTVTLHLQVWKELYRVMKHNSTLTLTAFNPMSAEFRDDPEARIAISKNILDRLFSDVHRVQLTSRMPVGLRLGIHFYIVTVTHEFNLRWQRDLKSGKRSEDEVLLLSESHPNVIKQSHFKIRADKSKVDFNEESVS